MSRRRRTRLLLIGINDYEHWKPLYYPVSDCEGFFKVLKNHYGFLEDDLIHENKRPLYDAEATTDMIYDELYRLSDKDESGTPHLSADDNLIVYYAGHGHLDKTVDEGYWAPVDAPLPKRPSDLKKLISVSEVVKILSKIPSHHIVLMVDACFPQTFARMVVDVPHGSGKNNPEEKPSRWALTSGRLEPVVDKSPFAIALRRLLETNDKPKLSIVTFGAGVMERVRESGLQNAWCAPLTENRFDGGEFFFYRQSPISITDQAPRPDIATETLPQRMRQGSKQYLERLKAGRFKYLRIEKLLITETNLPDFVDAQVKVLEQVTPLQKAVQSVWGQAQPHAVILGEGGMGKTVSLLRLWEDWLDSPAAAVPVFVALNEYNAQREAERADFVLHSIARNCGLAENLTDDWKNALWNILRTPRPDASPTILLLLDGFNEVTAERTPLLIELNRLALEARSVQMVISSRYTEIRNFQWAQQSEILELQALPTDKIEGYLHGLDLHLPKADAMRQLLGNPMMLTIYAGSSQIANRHASDTRFRFLPRQSVGELLWNFTEAQLVKYYEDYAHDPDEQIWHRFLLRCLLPYIAWRIEERGDFFLAYRRRSNPDFNFQMLLDEAFEELNRPELTDIFPEFEGKRDWLGLGELSDLDAREQRARRAREYLVEKLTLLVLEKDELRFLHQNFRDFFSACHLLNVADMTRKPRDLRSPEPDNRPVKSSLLERMLKTFTGSRKNFQTRPIWLPHAWVNRSLPVYLRRILGQIEGEHHYDPQKVLAGAPMPGFQTNNRLAHLLNQCRNNFHDEPTQTAVMNLVRTLAEGRQTLAGADLRGLDLQKICLNSIPLSMQQNYHYLTTQFEGALIKGKMLFAQGHLDKVICANYSWDGKKILSGASDNTVKEWSVETGECLHTLMGHNWYVTNAVYSPDMCKILSTSEDKTIIEWSAATGERLMVYKGHDDIVNNAVYSPDGLRIISSSKDKTIKEWSVKTGKCLKTFIGHKSNVTNVLYSPDGHKILSVSHDTTIKQWSAATGVCIQTFNGHDGSVNSAVYSWDGLKILSASGDETLKEWSVATGECLQTFIGHNKWVFTGVYSPDGLKILSASWDNTLKEWSISTRECLRTYRGHIDAVNTAKYSSDGLKILSASWDNTIKEWSVKTGECLQTFIGYLRDVKNSIYSPDGLKILSASWNHTLVEWSAVTGRCLQIFTGHTDWVNIGAYSHDGTKVLSASRDHTLKEWSVLTGKCLQTYTGHKDAINSAVYSPDGLKILSASRDHTLKEWSVQTGECLQTFIGHKDSVESAVYSSDGCKILSASANYDNTMKEWSVKTGECLQTFKGNDSRFHKAVYSPDDLKILSTSYSVSFDEWSVETGKLLQTFQGHGGSVTSIAYSPDGSKALSSSIDASIKEWSVLTGTCLQTYKGDISSLHNCAYSPDGRKILSSSHLGRIEEWSVEKGTRIQTLIHEFGLIVQGCDFSRCHPTSVFTEEERERLRQYGAIFDKKDQEAWEATTEEARSGLRDDKN